MENRRRFLTRGLGAMLGLGSGGLVLHALAQDNPENLARGMITPATQEAIDAGLAYLEGQQHPDGSFGTNQQRGNVAITSLGGLAFMAGGHQPGRGRYGRVVTRALQYVLSQEDRNTPGFLTNQQAAFHGPMYGHGFATLFLAEAHGMVNQAELRDSAPRHARSRRQAHRPHAKPGRRLALPPRGRRRRSLGHHLPDHGPDAPRAMPASRCPRSVPTIASST